MKGKTGDAHPASFSASADRVLFAHRPRGVWRSTLIGSRTPLGSLRVVALDTLSIDSIRIDLDDVRLGQFRNPHLLRNIVAGIHKIMVSSTLGATTSRTVEVVRDCQTDLLVQLLAIGPYVGSAAPMFTARTIAGDTMSIEKLRGKAVFLAFFEHT